MSDYWWHRRAMEAEAKKMKQLFAGEILHQDSDHILKFAGLIKEYQELAAKRDWEPPIRSWAYDEACNLVDQEETVLTEHEAEVLITVFVCAACRTAILPGRVTD